MVFGWLFDRGEKAERETRPRTSIRTNGHFATYMRSRGPDHPLPESPPPSRRSHSQTPITPHHRSPLPLSPAELESSYENEELLGAVGPRYHGSPERYPMYSSVEHTPYYRPHTAPPEDEEPIYVPRRFYHDYPDRRHSPRRRKEYSTVPVFPVLPPTPILDESSRRRSHSRRYTSSPEPSPQLLRDSSPYGRYRGPVHAPPEEGATASSHRYTSSPDSRPPGDNSPISTLTTSSEFTKRHSSREGSGDSVSSLATASSGSGSGFRRPTPLPDDQDHRKPLIPRRIIAEKTGQKRVTFFPSSPRNPKNPLSPMDFDFTSSEPFPFFLGRLWVLKEIGKAVRREQDLSLKESMGICITGAPGSGKTSILLHLLDHSPFSRNDYQEIDSDEPVMYNGPQNLARILGGMMAAHHFCRVDDAPTCLIPDFVHNIAAQLARCPHLLAYRDILLRNLKLQESLSLESCIRNPSLAFKNGILKPLRSIKRPPTNLYIAVDALDEAQLHVTENGVALASFLADHYQYFPSWLKMVVTVRASCRDLVRHLQFVNLSDMPMEDRVRDDLHCYISHRMNTSVAIRHNIIVHDGSHSRLISYLAKLSKGSMLYLRYALDLIEKGLIIVKSSSFKVIPVSLWEIYQLIFNSRFNTEASYQKVRPILQVCLAATTPMTEVELYYSVRSGFLTSDLTFEKFKSLILPLVHDNNILALRKDGRFHFPHQTLREWLQRRDLTPNCLRFLCEPKDGHAWISFRMSRWDYPLPAERLFDFAHHILKAHMYKNIDRSRMPHANPVHLQAHWIQHSTHCIKSALGNLRNLYSPNICVSKLLLLAGADPNYRTSDGSLLAITAGGGHAEMVSALLDFGATMDNAALSAACLNGHLDILQKLLYWRPRPRNGSLPPISPTDPPRQLPLINQMDLANRCPLIYAAMGGHLNIFNYLLSFEWPKEGTPYREVMRRSLLEAAAHGQLAMCLSLLDTCDLSPDLAIAPACSGGYTNLYHSLLERGARPDVESIHAAARNGHIDLLKLLIQLLGIDMLDEEGRTPLMSAAIGDQPDAIDMLLHHGANIAAVDSNGRTAISWASLHGSYNAAYTLLLQGALVNHVDKSECIPLALAAMSASVETAFVLLEAGAVVEHTDSSGMRPLDWAIRANGLLVVALLLRHGATIGSQTWTEAYGKDAIMQLLLQKLYDDGLMLAKKGRLKVAAQRFAYGLKKFPKVNCLDLHKLQFKYLTELARCKRKLSDLEGAVEAADQAIAMCPNSYEGYLQRARATKECGRVNEALKDITEAIKCVRIESDIFYYLTQLQEDMAAEPMNSKAEILHEERGSLPPNTDGI